MMRVWTLLLCSMTALGLLLNTGCDPKPVKKGKTTANAKGGHDHDHDHAHGDHDDHADHDDHVHEEGPNGGHIDHFDSSDVHFEWTHDNAAGKFAVYFEEAVSKGAKVESVRVDITSGERSKSFTLEADDKAKIAGSAFVINSKELIALMSASTKDDTGAKATLVATVDGKEVKKLLVHDHDHAH